MQMAFHRLEWRRSAAYKLQRGRAMRNTVAFVVYRGAWGVATLGLLAGMAGCSDSQNDISAIHKINGSVHVVAGTPAGDAATVNGSIEVDANAALGSASTVNGSINIGAHATSGALNSVNGSITLEPNAHASGGMTSVNGALTLRDKSEVGGAVTSVNGAIEVSDAHVAGAVKTANGDINISGGSVVDSGIRVTNPASGIFHSSSRNPRIVIGPGATVRGEMHFEREVALYVSDRATIGPISGAKANRFSGDVPPG
jgi:hypothetical protein